MWKILDLLDNFSIYLLFVKFMNKTSLVYIIESLTYQIKAEILLFYNFNQRERFDVMIIFIISEHFFCPQIFCFDNKLNVN